MSALAGRFAAAMRRADKLDPDAIAKAIAAHADTGLRGTRYDRAGRATSVPCAEHETCPDGPEEHSHHVTADPTGNAAVTGRFDTLGEYRRLNDAVKLAIRHARVVFDFVAGREPTTWAEMLAIATSLMPGTIQAGIDVDDEHLLPSNLEAVIRAVDDVDRLAQNHMPRRPTSHERHWTAGLADEDCCVWHLEIHQSYRRPRLPGKNICQACVHLMIFSDGVRPPRWLLEADLDREASPRAWDRALGRWVEELGGGSTTEAAGRG